MPSSSIAQILLRIFALNWFLLGVIQLASLAITFRREYFTAYSLAPAIIYLVAGIVIWMTSPKLSRILAHRNDGEFHLVGVTESQLYAAVFLGLGLYFTLTSVAETFSWIHFFAVRERPEFGFEKIGEPSYYEMSEAIMTLAAGLFLVFTCKTWARKLARLQSEDTVGGECDG